MYKFLRRHRVALICIALLIASFFVFIAFGHNTSHAGKSRGLFLEITSPVFELIGSFFHKVGSVWDHYIHLKDLKEENEELKKHLERISSKYDNLKTLYIETEKNNRRLEEMLGFTMIAPYTLLPARVIGSDPAPYSSAIIIDKGKENGVVRDLPVMSVSGIVGIVLNVSDKSSTVMLLNDRRSRIAVTLQDDRTRGVLEGYADGTIHLSFVDRKNVVEPGDVVVTSGMENIFPKGLLVGRIAEAKRPKYGLFQDIVVAPKVDLKSVEEVLIIIRSKIETPDE
ncbi:MAG: rod shape-determining protein MreC [Deltaproteobacteria bacterium]|uniref:Cell shape-determining protein MreC n=1 Tax=Candidatus Zymogenus saltonus TaxID=2844893 RepID=A0A9D8PNL8_9DELT|nr:rod shape-determining protein MreC [Candidatus Zymogenus saltonus]